MQGSGKRCAIKTFKSMSKTFGRMAFVRLGYSGNFVNCRLRADLASGGSAESGASACGPASFLGVWASAPAAAWPLPDRPPANVAWRGSMNSRPCVGSSYRLASSTSPGLVHQFLNGLELLVNTGKPHVRHLVDPPQRSVTSWPTTAVGTSRS